MPRPLWVALAAVVLFVLGTGLRIGMPIYRQRAAIGKIQKLGGNVEVRAAGPAWLRELLGHEREELLDEVVAVNLADRHATDATLGCVAQLNGIESLFLSRTQVTDAGLEHLSWLPKLKNLLLADTRVTDLGLGRLKSVAALQCLSLSDTPVSDAGLAHLKGLANLRDLYLYDTQVTDAGVVELERELPVLEVHR